MNALSPLSARPAIALSAVAKRFGTGTSVTHALREADFEARAGEMTFLIGPSGCGKTTLLSVLSATLKADAGDVRVLGEDLQALPEAERTRFRARNVGFVFQQFNLIPTISVAENVAVPLLIQGERTGRAQRRARELLAEVGLGDRADERPSRLSGGQQQRVAIARALVHAPALLVCDEPTSALDRANGHHVMELLRGAARQPGRTVIVVTHDPRVYGYADRMAEMEDGRVWRVLEDPAAIEREHAASVREHHP